MDDCILRESADDGVVTLSLNRPQRRNALTPEMYARLGELLQAADRDEAVRAIVLTGAGGYFTAGNDLQEFGGAEPPAGLSAMAFLKPLAALGKPLLAALEGGAIGIGSTLLLHCDFVYAGRSTRFATPFVKLGVCPEAGSSLLLPQAAGLRKASELLLLGEPFDAETAAAAGLLSAVVEDGAALATALATARKLAALPPDAVQSTRALLRRSSQAALSEALALEEAQFVRLLGTAPARAAVQGFLKPKG